MAETTAAERQALEREAAEFDAAGMPAMAAFLRRGARPAPAKPRPVDLDKVPMAEYLKREHARLAKKGRRA